MIRLVDGITTMDKTATANFYARQKEFQTAASWLCETASTHKNIIVEMINLLKVFGRTIGVNDECVDSRQDGIAAVKSYIDNIVASVNRIKQKNEELQIEIASCKKKTLDYEAEIVKSGKDYERMQILENALHCTKHEVAVLRKELFKKEEALKIMHEEADKNAKIKNLKTLNEERIMSKKELEDMEDSIAREMKVVHMRKIFVQGMLSKMKDKEISQDDNKPLEQIEKSVSRSMENMKILKNEIDNIQKIVQKQNTTR